MQVSAMDKSTSKEEKITISNEKGRLSKEDIERMVKEAEEFGDEDKKVKERIEARNQLEGVVYNLKNQVSDDDKLGSKLDEDDKKAINDAVKEALDWLDENPNAEKEEYEEALKKLQAVSNPIVQRAYQKGGGAPGGEDAGGEGGANPDSTDDL